MPESKEHKTSPPPPKPGETLLEYSIRIGKDNRTPDQIKNDSLEAGKDTPKDVSKEKDK